MSSKRAQSVRSKKKILPKNIPNMLKNLVLRHILFVVIIASLLVLSVGVSGAQIGISKLINSQTINLSVEHKPSEEPLRISIARIGIDIKVENAEIENGTWRVPEHSAGYAEGSAYLDEEHGNTIIFAHARHGLFRNLPSIQYGDEIGIIGTKNLYRYKVTSIEKILPDEIDKIKSFGDHQLTLFTCDGIDDEYRLLVKAKRIDISSLSDTEII